MTAPAPAVALAALPVINIAPWLDTTDGGLGRLSTAAALHAACLEYGFFYLDISSFVDMSEPEELARMAREFFALPQAEKDRISLQHQDGARGTESPDLFGRSAGADVQWRVQATSD